MSRGPVWLGCTPCAARATPPRYVWRPDRVQAWTGETTSWLPHGVTRGAARSDTRCHRGAEPGSDSIAALAVRHTRAPRYSLLVTKLSPKCALAPGLSATV